MAAKWQQDVGRSVISFFPRSTDENFLTFGHLPALFRHRSTKVILKSSSPASPLSHLSGGGKHVSHSGRTDADEHLEELGSRDGDEGDSRLACRRLGEQRLSGSGWSSQHGTLRDLRAQLDVLSGEG